jgi:folate-binding protein YgfZ
MRNASASIRLDDMGIVRVRGPDASRFLQGQLSNDLDRLNAENSVLAGYHTPQGRAIALLRLVYWDAGDVVAVVPRLLAPVVAGRLGKFVLRSKVKITDESAGWRINGVVGDGTNIEAAGAAAGLGAIVGSQVPAIVSSQVRVGDSVFVRLDADRVLVVSPVDATAVVAGSVASAAVDSGAVDVTTAAPAAIGSTGAADVAAAGASAGDNLVNDQRQAWTRLAVAAGEPQVVPATSEEFVAQMLNLDVLNAIAFDKGCYTGQEVIARAHYRGRVKRRMQRFISRAPVRLAPGDSGQLADGRSFKVVLAAQLEDGRCDFLAVAPLPGTGTDEAPAGIPTAAASAGTPAAAVTMPLVADPASLPYALPD